MPQNLRREYHVEPLVQAARELRRTSTDAETALWQILRQRPLGSKFRRQHPFGRYILDFYCIEKKLAIEADGSQHYSATAREADEERTRNLEVLGIRVLRFSNREILTEREAVLRAIEQALAGV
jgi:leucyl-tRNA synthetase